MPVNPGIPMPPKKAKISNAHCKCNPLSSSLLFLQFKLQCMIFRAIAAVKVAKAFANSNVVLAHIYSTTKSDFIGQPMSICFFLTYRPRIVGIPGQVAVGADFDAVGPDVVVVVANVPRVGICAHDFVVNVCFFV